MKTYAYYPGCSLETLAASYHVSAVETAARLDVELREIEDWNCCGATPYSHIDQLLGQALCARNLAIAERSALDVVAPCNGCYKNLYFANVHLRDDPDLAEHVNFALEADDLHYAGNVSVHHLIQVFVNDVGLETIRSRTVRPLKGLRVAPYYGCHLVRPRREGATPADSGGPRFFEDLLAAIGATPVVFPHRLRCCGGSLIATNRHAALAMVRDVLQCATDARADVIATTCPLCQINLECYQGDVNRAFGTAFAVPVLYFTQLMGLALGVGPRRLGIGRELVPAKAVLACARGHGLAAPTPAGSMTAERKEDQ
jgi:heterodisulfide reductase subunit B